MIISIYNIESKLLPTLVTHKDYSLVKGWSNYFYLSLPTIFFFSPSAIQSQNIKLFIFSFKHFARQTSVILVPVHMFGALYLSLWIDWLNDESVHSIELGLCNPPCSVLAPASSVT